MSDLQWNIDFAREQSGDDPELLAELLDLLRSSSKSDYEAMASALAAGDGDAFADAAHSIKGAAASLGVEGLRAVAADLEQKGRSGAIDGVDLAPIKDLIAQLDSLQA